MKIALIGYGKMGKTIEKIALERGHEILVRIDPSIKSESSAAQTLVQEVDVCIDFSDANGVKDHVLLAAHCKKPIVIGTTGWHHHFVEVKQCVLEAGIGAIYSPNFSLGVNLFVKIVEEAAKLFAPFEAYDVAGFEIHHNQKLDSPSGTALALKEKVLQEMKRKTHMEFSSLRCGHVPGTHTLIFDSAQDSIILTHEARNRNGFAKGALMAAEWLQDKQGFFTMNDLLKSFS